LRLCDKYERCDDHDGMNNTCVMDTVDAADSWRMATCLLGLVEATQGLPVPMLSAPEDRHARKVRLHVVLHHRLIGRVAARHKARVNTKLGSHAYARRHGGMCLGCMVHI
jgi:hypothetical protein